MIGVEKNMYDWKYIRRCLAFILCFCVAMRLIGGDAFAIFPVLLFYAYLHRKYERVLFYVLFGALALSLNGALVPKGGVFSIVHRGSYFLLGIIGFFQILGKRKIKVLAPLSLLFIYLAYMIIPSMDGWAPRISMLKLLLFSTVFMAIISSANLAMLNPRFDVAKLRGMFLAFAVVFILGSVVMIPFPGISQMTPEESLLAGTETSLFRGVTGHSQWLGTLVATFAVMLFADLCFNIQRLDRLYLALLLACPYLIFKTSSRTGMGTMLFGLGYVVYESMKSRQLRSRWKAKLFNGLFLICILGGIAVIVTPGLNDSVVRFAMKYDQAAKRGDFKLERAISTRKGLMDIQLENFKKKPAIGNGFQVKEDTADLMARRKGLVLSAPVEKGVWVSAVLEEGGAIGFLIYMMFATTVYFVLISNRAIIGSAMFLLIHVANLGEFTMFSMSGNGGITWTLQVLALCFDYARTRATTRCPGPQGMPWPQRKPW